jgi:ribosomal protein S18 acetylase RimI-like enzyme
MIRLTIKRLKKGDWDRYKHTISKLEKSAFAPVERTNKWIFRDFINHYNPFTTIFYYGRIPVGYYLATHLEISCDNNMFRKIDKQYGKHNTLYLYNFGVDKKYQKLGIGRKMFEHLIKVSERKFKRITLHSRNKNMRKLAFRNGFRMLEVPNVFQKRMKYVYMAKWLKQK